MDLDRLSAEVRPVQLQQVEGVEKCLGLVPPMSDHMEGGHSLFVAAHHLGIDKADRTLRWFTAWNTSG
jgi:hypothetical protein